MHIAALFACILHVLVSGPDCFHSGVLEELKPLFIRLLFRDDVVQTMQVTDDVVVDGAELVGSAQERGLPADAHGLVQDGGDLRIPAQDLSFR